MVLAQPSGATTPIATAAAPRPHPGPTGDLHAILPQPIPLVTNAPPQEGAEAGAVVAPDQIAGLDHSCFQETTTCPGLAAQRTIMM